MFLLAASTAVTGLTTLGTVFQQIVQWVIDFLGMISSEPLLLIGLGIMVVGVVIGIAFKAVKGRGKGK